MIRALNKAVCQMCRRGFIFSGVCANPECGGGSRDGMRFASIGGIGEVNCLWLSRSRVVTKAGREMWMWEASAERGKVLDPEGYKEATPGEIEE